MIIGDRYAENKMYRGIRNYNSLPLISEDIHEASDTLSMKTSIMVENILGSGILKSTTCTVSSTGIALDSPIAAFIGGDLMMIQGDPGNIVSATAIASAGYSKGLVCIIGWYQQLTSSDTLRSYGGVNNVSLTNNLIYTPLGIQVSTRYQMRWDVIILDPEEYDSDDNIIYNLINRDKDGNVLTGTTEITLTPSTGRLRTANRPSSMTYGVSNLYVLPIIEYTYDSDTSTILASVEDKLHVNVPVIYSTTQPTGVYSSGTIWYNSSANLMKFYIPGVGFKNPMEGKSLSHYTNTSVITVPSTTPSDIQLNIGIQEYESGDTLNVFYNGILMLKDTHYTLDTTNKRITLLSMTTESNDEITFDVLKLE